MHSFSFQNIDAFVSGSNVANESHVNEPEETVETTDEPEREEQEDFAEPSTETETENIEIVVMQSDPPLIPETEESEPQKPLITEDPSISEELLITDEDKNTEESVVAEPQQLEKTTTTTNIKEKYKVLILLSYTAGTSVFPIENIDQDIFLIESKTKQSKWKNVCWFLENHDMWKQYEHIWIPDSNVSVTQEDITRFVNTIHDNSVTIGQPSLINNKKCYIHKVLIHKPRSHFRKTHFVENKLVCFKRSFVEEHLLEFLKANREHLETGWGIDMWWSYMHGNKGLYVLDSVKVENVKNDDPLCDKVGKTEMKHFVSKYAIKLRI